LSCAVYQRTLNQESTTRLKNFASGSSENATGVIGRPARNTGTDSKPAHLLLSAESGGSPCFNAVCQPAPAPGLRMKSLNQEKQLF
jgi:hypothetical protein